MYESDGSIMVYWHALDTPETPTGVYILTLDLLIPDLFHLVT